MVINLNEKVYNLVKDNEKLKDLLSKLGFKEIVKPLMLKTVGKVMTLKAGASMRKIDLLDLIETLEEKGYKVEGKE
ncbi:MAG: DUF1858 domain-containing protein [Acholeplasmataceae bacterium]|jgi:hypothetical protein|nr:DUF1858 domain-containing protein [Acholeplasmataceae bacterium]